MTPALSSHTQGHTMNDSRPHVAQRRGLRLIAALVAILITIAGVSIVQSQSSAPLAQAQAQTMTEIPLGSTSVATQTVATGSGYKFTAVASASGSISQLALDLPDSTTVGLVLGSAANQFMVDGATKARETKLQPGEVALTLSRDAATGEVTLTPSTPIDVVAGQTLSIIVAFQSAVTTTDTTLHAWTAAAAPTTSATPTPTPTPTSSAAPVTTASATSAPATTTASAAPSATSSSTSVATSAAPTTSTQPQMMQAQMMQAAAASTSQYTVTSANGTTTWSTDYYSMSATATKVTISKTITDFEYISGPIVGRVTSQNGYDVWGDGILDYKQSTVKILDGNGNVVYTWKGQPKPNTATLPVGAIDTTNTNGWGGISHNPTSTNPSFPLLAQPGWSIVVELAVHATTGTKQIDTTVKSPIGPGELTYTSTPMKCNADSSPLDYTLDGVRYKDPYPRPSGTSTTRMAPRQLTPEELQRGTTAYVTASIPGGQSRNGSQLYYQESITGAFKEIGGKTGWIINALAYNSQDNYLYAISQPRDGIKDVWTRDANGKITNTNNTTPAGQSIFFEDPCYPAGHLLQIHPVTGEIVDLGRITEGAGSTMPNNTGYGFQGIYGQNWPNDLWGGINVGFFDANGTLWMANGSLSGTGALYKVDINNVTATTNFDFAANPGQRTPADYGTDNIGDTAWRAYAEDYAILPDAPQYAWGIVNSWNSPDYWVTDKKVYLERIDLATGMSERFDITNLTTSTGAKISTGNQWSKVWVYGDGTLGLGTGSTGANNDIARISITNPGKYSPTFELMSIIKNAPGAYNTNGTSNGFATPFKTDLEIKKTLVRIDSTTNRTSWAIDVWNNGPHGISQFQVLDQVPSQYSSVTVDKIEYFDGLSTVSTPNKVNVNGNTVNIYFGNLPARLDPTNPQVRVFISAALPAGTDPGCYPNTAEGMNAETDTNAGNNTATADCSGDPVISKTVKDVNGDGTADSKDVISANGMFKVTYDVTVSNPSNSLTANYGTVYDTPKFPSDVLPVQKVVVTKPGSTTPVDAPAATDKTGSYILDTPGTLKPSESKTYVVEVYFLKMLPLKTNPEKGICSAGDTGLLNEASVNSLTSTACVDVPNDMYIEVVKIDADEKTSVLPGAEFIIYASNPDGTKGAALKKLTDTDNGYLLTPGEQYIIEETKSPYINGVQYKLLAEPVYFHTEWKDGAANIIIDHGGSSLIIPGTKATDKTIGLLQVADVREGSLPRTGGVGVLPYLLAGLALFGAAMVFARRRQLS